MIYDGILCDIRSISISVELFIASLSNFAQYVCINKINKFLISFFPTISHPCFYSLHLVRVFSLCEKAFSIRNKLIKISCIYSTSSEPEPGVGSTLVNNGLPELF